MPYRRRGGSPDYAKFFTDPFQKPRLDDAQSNPSNENDPGSESRVVQETLSQVRDYFEASVAAPPLRFSEFRLERFSAFGASAAGSATTSGFGLLLMTFSLMLERTSG